MEGAESLAVRLETEWTGFDPNEGIDGVDDVEQREFFGIDGETHSSANPRLRFDDSGFAEALQNLGEVGLGNLDDVRNLLCRLRLRMEVGEMHNRAEGVFNGLREH